MGLLSAVRGWFVTAPSGADDIAIGFTQALLVGDFDTAEKLASPSFTALPPIVARYADADLARWFGKLKAMGAPPTSMLGVVDATFRYVVGRVNLPNDGSRDFPIVTVALRHVDGRWQVVHAKPNSALFEEGEVDEQEDQDDSADRSL